MVEVVDVKGFGGRRHVNSISTKLWFVEPELPVELEGGAGVWVRGTGVWVRGAGVWVRGTGVWVRGTGVWVRGAGVWVRGTGVWVRGTGVWVRGAGVWVRGAGVWVRGAGVWVRGTRSCCYREEVETNIIKMVTMAMSCMCCKMCCKSHSIPVLNCYYISGRVYISIT